MTPRALLTGIGATALGFGLVIGGNLAPTALAQSTDNRADTKAAVEEQRAQAYDDFVASLADDLNADEADVDAAIRDALKAQVDQRLADGELSAEEAAALKAVIDVTESPLPLGFGMIGHAGMMGRFGAGHEARGGDDGDHGARGGVEDDRDDGGRGNRPSDDMMDGSADGATDNSADGTPQSKDSGNNGQTSEESGT